MRFTDFKYDKMYLSDVDCIVCTFSGIGSLDSVSNGSEITFNTVPMKNGSKFELASTQYDSCIEATFQICKNPEGKKKNEEMYFSTEEVRYITKWLNRKQYHEFKMVGENYIDIYYMASFNVTLLKLGDNVCGFELNMYTDRPFALRREFRKTYTVRNGNSAILVRVDSDEEGYIQPKVKIKVGRAGNLSIINSEIPSEELFIRNCSVNEEIVLDYPMIETSNITHKIQNDFNWNFLKLYSSFNTRTNSLLFSLPCTIEISYTPVAKINI